MNERNMDANTDSNSNIDTGSNTELNMGLVHKNNKQQLGNEQQDAFIHSTAIIEDGAVIGNHVTIGAYSIVGKNVTLGDHVHLSHHVVVTGNTTIGAHCHIYPFASIGSQPQDLKYKGEASELSIGTHTIFREHVTVNTGTEGGIMNTQIGNHCLFMVGSHVAHDCIVGDHVILANNATLAGHVEVGDFAIIGGLSAVRQFVRIGAHAMIGGMSGIESDVIPYGQAVGDRAHLSGLNLVGLKRRGFSRDAIHSLRSAYRLMFSPEGTLAERLYDVKERFATSNAVQEIISFVTENNTSSALCQPKQTGTKEQTTTYQPKSDLVNEDHA